jgi:hypothetical protein
VGYIIDADQDGKMETLVQIEGGGTAGNVKGSFTDIWLKRMWTMSVFGDVDDNVN